MVPKKNGIIVDKGYTEVEDEERPTQVQKRFGKIQKKGSDQKALSKPGKFWKIPLKEMKR